MAYDFETALANLIGSGNPLSPPVRAREFTFNAPTYTVPTLGTSGSGSVGGISLPPPDSSSSGTSWWATQLERLSSIANAAVGLGGVVTNQLANWTDGEKNWKDIPFAESIGSYFKGVASPVTDDGFQWTDALHFLNPLDIMSRGFNEMGKNTKTTRDAMNNLGWLKEAPADPNKGWNPLERRANNLDYADLIALTGDILLDPFTILTFGASGALKAGVSAAAREGAEQLARHGIKAAIPRAVRNSADEIAQFAEREIAKKAGERAGIEARVAIENAAKTARNTAQNALVSLDIPFTNIHRPLVMKGKDSIFRVTDPKIGKVGGDAVRRIFTSLGIISPDDQARILKRVYDVDDPANMTSQMLDHFTANIGRVQKGEDIVEVFKPVTDEILTYHPFTPDDVLKGITDPAERNYVRNVYNELGTTSTTPQIFGNYRTMLNDLNRVRTELPGMLEQRADEIFQFANDAPKMVDQNDVLRSIDELLRAGDAFRQAGHTANIGFAPFEKVAIKVPNAAKTAENIQSTFDLYKFAQDMGGTSDFGNWISNKLKFINPRTFGSVNRYVNQAADRVRDAEMQIRGNLTQMGRELLHLQQLGKNLTPDDWDKVKYVVERAFPGGQTLDQFLAKTPNKEQIVKVADATRSLFERLATREQEAGALSGTIENYFPHILKRSELSKEQIDAIFNDQIAQKYLGRSAANRFNQARKGPESFAAWDDMISQLEQALKRTTNPDEAAKIEAKIDEISALFSRDTFESISARYRRHIQTTAMTELYTDLRRTGFLKTTDDAAIDGIGNMDFTQITDDLQRRLGLPGQYKGGSIHKEVLAGLEKVSNLFTTEGANQIYEIAKAITSIWKGLVTTPIPSHHFNNLIGNVANNALAGVELVDYRRAANLLRKLKLGKLSEAEQKLIQEAYDRGVLASGMVYEVADPFRQARLDQLGKLGKFEDWIINNPWSRFMRSRVGDNVEDFTRLALYLKGKRSGLSAKQSSDLVRKYLFAYGEHTPEEGLIRLVAPFWTWTKNNLPLQIMEFLRQPRYYGIYRDLQRMVDDESNSAKPDWVGDYLKVPGTDRYVNLRLPMQDLTNFTENPFAFLANMASPALKVPFEVSLNKQVFTQRPIDYDLEYHDQVDPAAWMKYAASQFGLPGRMINLFTADDPLTAMLRMAFPFLPYEVDQEKAIRDKREQIRAEKRR